MRSCRAGFCHLLPVHRPLCKTHLSLYRAVARKGFMQLQEQLEEGHPNLPREAPVLSKIMSPAAMSDLHWTRVPAVVIFGCVVADEEGEWRLLCQLLHMCRMSMPCGQSCLLP
eukprot:GHUV01050037.1.p1 GENE.GHUV01050037.1~~GHUV01050037.1.p1  ORF type:complete len:113 (+),score=10.40 GHUV01050037.1:59-397(+)